MTDVLDAGLYYICETFLSSRPPLLLLFLVSNASKQKQLKSSFLDTLQGES